MKWAPVRDRTYRQGKAFGMNVWNPMAANKFFEDEVNGI